MQEIIEKNNATSLRVFINGVPNLRLIPRDEAENTIIALELQISKFFKIKKENYVDKT